MVEESTPHDVISADPRERKRLLVLLLVGSIVVVWVVGWLTPRVKVEAQVAIAEGRLAQSAVCQSVLIGLGFFSCAVAAFGVHARRFGKAVLAAGRFPPPGMTVVRATRVMTGRPAMAVGRVQALLGSSLGVLGSLLFCLVLYALARISFG